MDTLRHGVLGVLHRDGEVVLVRKSGRPDDEWLFPGGGLEDGESVRDAFSREMDEELGLARGDMAEVCVTDVVHRHPWPDPSVRETEGQEKRVVVARVRDGADPRPDTARPGPGGEIAEIRWVDRENVAGMLPFDDLTASFRAVEGMVP